MTDGNQLLLRVRADGKRDSMTVNLPKIDRLTASEVLAHDPRVPPIAVKVAHILRYCFAKQGSDEIAIGWSGLAALVGQSEGRIERSIEALAALGYLKVDRGSGGLATRH